MLLFECVFFRCGNIVYVLCIFLIVCMTFLCIRENVIPNWLLQMGDLGYSSVVVIYGMLLVESVFFLCKGKVYVL